MKKLLLLSIFVSITLTAICQNEGRTFVVEEGLSKPSGLIKTMPIDKIYENFIISGYKVSPIDIKNGKVKVPFNIVAQSKVSGELVNFGYHSFFSGMYQAYADHRPFVLSPDMIWLLINQGFARHVNANSEALRDKIVSHDGVMTLVVRNDTIKLDDPNSPWEEVFPEFTKKIAENTKGNLLDILTCDFSTTTSVEKIASEITIMEAVKSYFEFVLISIGCGIPEITLQGTTKDWEKILEKTKQLAKYDLNWWTSELEPLLKEFVQASKGKIDKDFWINMFRYHTSESYGNPKVIDGWIVKFFPYDKHGKRNNLKGLTAANNLPDEIVKVKLLHKNVYPYGLSIDTELELWAGFIGLEQNSENFALTPKIGWMIRKKDTNDEVQTSKFEQDLRYVNVINIRVNEIPEAIYNLEAIPTLKVEFIGKIVIPDKLAKVKIDKLFLRGEITDEEKVRIRKLFPNTIVNINGDNPVSTTSGSVTVVEF